MIVGAGVLSLLAAVALFVLTFTGYLGDDGNSTIETAVGINEAISTQAHPTPTVPPSDAPLARISIPKFEVDAPIVVLGVDGNGIMESPSGPTDVAWYDFSAKPGFGSNAVFSGHVDYHNYGPAVFWNLKDLGAGDIIEVRLEDGTVYQYRVFNREQIYAQGADVGAIVGSTPNEIITLITCGGTFDGGTAQYDQRVIVRAERVYDDGAGTATTS